ncbi:hypothetical protein JTE90_013355 [Oedothorax gibbosus]|uniref:Uncharacterized protein n=1 Tax=Oedothorax gibbosus TaxID=931172 RepID=A0AAV6TVN3_9ARAC|nr:hypothetical protein JTE90_013355 [Oedothorax gibbosus]
MEVRNSERPIHSVFVAIYQSSFGISLKTRVFQVRVGSPCLETFTNECPPGSVLSVVLFILKINGIVEQLSPAVKDTCCG